MAWRARGVRQKKHDFKCMLIVFGVVKLLCGSPHAHGFVGVARRRVHGAEWAAGLRACGSTLQQSTRLYREAPTGGGGQARVPYRHFLYYLPTILGHGQDKADGPERGRTSCT